MKKIKKPERKTVIMLKGLPGSGKSTWAKKALDTYPGVFKRVNKDDLRAMMDNGQFAKNNEKFVLKVRDFIVREALKEGWSVIVDDTNFNPYHELQLRKIAVESLADFKVIFFDTPVEECIARDLRRPNSVGKDVIESMAKKYGISSNGKFRAVPPPIDESLKWAIICDIDGTLALIKDRNPYDASTCENDDLNKPVKYVLDLAHQKGDTIFLFSGREDKYRPQTESWLKKNNVPYDYLFMRETGDSRKDKIVKHEMYADHVRGQYNVRFVIDDRKQVVEMWRDELGLTVFQVDWGEF